MSHPVPPSLKHTPFDPMRLPKGSAASKLPSPTTVPSYRVFEGFFVRNQRLSEALLFGLVGYGLYRWIYHDERADARHHEREALAHRAPPPSVHPAAQSARP